jgi:CHAD domain-containing protein
MAGKRSGVEKVAHGDGTKAALGAVAAGGALAVAKVGRDRLSSSDGRRRFRLADGEPVTEGIARIAGCQLEIAIEHLGGDGDEELGTAVHEARKSLKRLRTTIRLACGELGDEVYRRENVAFRDAGRRLAGARDSQVLLATLAAVSDREGAARDGYTPFRRTLSAQHAAAQKSLQQGQAVGDVLSELREARARVPEWPLERKGLDAVAPGFKRIYRRGRRAYRKAREEPSSENLHELRKRVKDLWYAAQIVRPVARKRMKRTARKAHRLSDLIGEDHDLALLAERAADRRDRFDDDAAADDLAERIERRRADLRSEALELGGRLYRKKPRKMVRPLEKSASRAA